MHFILCLTAGLAAYGNEGLEKCSTDFTKLVPHKKIFPSDDRSARALRELEAYLQSNTNHSITVKNGKGYVHLDILHQNQRAFIKLLLHAIKAGAIAEIDGGWIVGPKILTLLNQSRSAAPRSGAKILFRGYLEPGLLLDEFNNQVKRTQANEFKTGSPFHWSDRDIGDFQKAFAELGIERACRSIYAADLKECGLMDLWFEFGSKDIEWAKRDDF